MGKSIDPMLILGRAVDMSESLKGSEFPLGAMPMKIQRAFRDFVKRYCGVHFKKGASWSLCEIIEKPLPHLPYPPFHTPKWQIWQEWQPISIKI